MEFKHDNSLDMSISKIYKGEDGNHYQFGVNSPTKKGYPVQVFKIKMENGSPTQIVRDHKYPVNMIVQSIDEAVAYFENWAKENNISLD